MNADDRDDDEARRHEAECRAFEQECIAEQEAADLAEWEELQRDKPPAPVSAELEGEEAEEPEEPERVIRIRWGRDVCTLRNGVFYPSPDERDRTAAFLNREADAMRRTLDPRLNMGGLPDDHRLAYAIVDAIGGEILEIPELESVPGRIY